MNPTDNVRDRILSLMNFSHSDSINEAFKKANPFLQGNSNDWMMIEFWTQDADLIMNAVFEFEKEIGILVDQ